MKRTAYALTTTVLMAGSALVTLALVPEAAPVEQHDMVHVGITYGENGEAEAVELTDSEGRDIQVGSVAESWQDDNTDAEQ